MRLIVIFIMPFAISKKHFFNFSINIIIELIESCYIICFS